MRGHEFLGVETVDGDPFRTSYELAPHLTRLDGALFGGTALAAALHAFETATGRRVLWGTTQFVASAPVGTRIDQSVEVLAEGRNVCQVRLTASTEGRLLYTTNGATVGDRTGPVTEMVGSATSMPDVLPARDCPARVHHIPFGDLEFGFHLVTEHRAVRHPEPGKWALWTRLRDVTRHTPPSLAFLADFIPLGIAHAAGFPGAGTSLDNTLRVGQLVDTEWVLLDVEGSFARDGYGYGHAHLWSEDGVLLGTASQSSPLLIFPG